MSCVFRKTGIDEISLIVDMRIEFIKDLHPELNNEQLDIIRKGNLEYFNDAVKTGKYQGFAGSVDGRIVCCAGLLYYNLPPLHNYKARKIGHVLSFFTIKEERGKGFASGLMDYIKIQAKKDGIDRLILNATEMGFPLYVKSGFSESENRALQIDL